MKILIDTNVALVTRNTKDYSSGSIPAVTPEDFLHTIIADNS